jgi:hypothetical protein
MRRFTFTPEVLAAIRHDCYHHPHPRVQQKLEVLWLKSQGCTHEDIAVPPGQELQTMLRASRPAAGPSSSPCPTCIHDDG